MTLNILSALKITIMSVSRASVLMLLATVPSVYAETTEDSEEVETYTHQGRTYPPIFFLNYVPGDDFKKAFAGVKAFESLDKNVYGYPIGVRAWVTRNNNQTGASVTSTWVSLTTLGILPSIQNRSFGVHYQVLVQGDIVKEFEYEFTRNDTESVWMQKDEGQLVPVELKFLRSSIPRFFNDLKKADEVQEIFAEYHRYYSDNSPDKN